MKSNGITTKIIAMILLPLIASLLISCGGGGGGSSGSGNDTSGISYAGIREQAAIDEDNATELATESYSGGSVGSAMSEITAGQTEPSEYAYHPRVLRLSHALKDSLLTLDLTSRSTGTFTGTVYQESETIEGECGGSASYTISLNDQTGQFSGTFTYRKYCYGGAILSGTVDFSGEFDVNTGDILTFDFSFNNLRSTLGGDSVTIRGDMAFDMTGPTVTLTMTILIKDNRTDEVYWVKNYRLTLTEGSGYFDIQMSGRYYNPNYGYVSLATREPLRLYNSDDYPSSGVLLVTGEPGPEGGKTKARLTCHSSTTYQVEADTNGDGSYDFDTGVVNWADL